MSAMETNIQKAEVALDRLRPTGILNHIDGMDCPASDGTIFSSHCPVDNTALITVANGTTEDIDRAAKAAHAAFADWSQRSGEERKAILHRIADGIEARAEEIALLESLDTGQALRFMSTAAARGAANFRFFADQAPTAKDGQSLFVQGQWNITARKPIGAVGIITPWNTPFMLSTWKIAPALAAGCTVVHKPAELSPVTARILIEIAQEAGLPAGVLNLVNGFGETTGKALTEHPLIKAIAFVGESITGSHIMAQGAPTLKRVHFELGGKSPIVVFDDANFERAIDAAVYMIYSLNGERCTAPSRLLVQDSLYAEFTRRVAERASKIAVGHPLDPNTVVGPLIDPNHMAKVLSYIALGQTEGATIAAGGTRIGDTGCYVAPTLFTHANNSMRIAQEEIFGPVLAAIPFEDDAEALRLANDSDYGLTGYVWTQDITRALAFAEKMHTGMIWINSDNSRHLPAPFGGMKSSGIGRDGGDWSFDFYMETQNIALSSHAKPIPQIGL